MISQESGICLEKHPTPNEEAVSILIRSQPIKPSVFVIESVSTPASKDWNQFFHEAAPGGVDARIWWELCSPIIDQLYDDTHKSE